MLLAWASIGAQAVRLQEESKGQGTAGHVNSCYSANPFVAAHQSCWSSLEAVSVPSSPLLLSGLG